ncbi:phage major capsid protein [Aggregatilinea lenta]|uniref:phage major capsid protein n=1 Tax=Aggregatilinea lenta TaxID=913108 RepID=UPI000E5AD10C|nr:phage major capsid protein [Aggregatilinea lenta]
MYSSLWDLPREVREALQPDEQQVWLATFERVFAQTDDEDKARLAAWGEVRKDRAVAGRSVALRTVDGQPVVVGWGMKFTGMDDPDFYDTFFSTLTELLADYYQDAPLWYEHGLDPDYGWKPIGRRSRVEIYGFGVWAEHTLFLDHPLFARTLKEIRTGKLSYSSDSLVHYVEQGLNPVTGELRVWPLAGWALTQRPAEPGLGPVTLRDMQATIAEVVQAPARRFPLDGGRAQLTLTACKSVYEPQVDPTVPADVSPQAVPPVAREAHGDDSPEDETTVGIPSRSKAMDPELLAALADFLGVDATPETVRGELDGLISQASEGAPALDDAALRSALDLDDGAPDETVVDALRALRQALDTPAADEPDEHDVAPARTANYYALRAASQRLATLAPGNAPLPVRVPAATEGRRSRSLHAPNLNFNEARRPGVEDAVLVALGYRPPSFRADAPLSAIRARVFQLDRAARADSGDGPRGAFVLNTDLAQDILEPLRSKTVLVQAGATTVPMDGIDSLTLRKMVGVPGAYWAAENTETDGDEAEWSVATLTLKELRAPTSWPNRWLRNLARGAQGMITDQLVKSMRLKMEYSALFGTGGVPVDGKSTGIEPLGVRHTPGVTVTALDDVPDVDTLKAAQAALEDADVEESDTWGWLSHSRTFRTFEYSKDADGKPLMRDSWMDGVRSQTLVDFPYYKTTAIPKNLGAGGNETVLLLGDWQELLIGVGMDVELLVSEHVLLKQNATYVMGIAYVDTAVAYPEAFHIHTGVQA